MRADQREPVGRGDDWRRPAEFGASPAMTGKRRRHWYIRSPVRCTSAASRLRSGCTGPSPPVSSSRPSGVMVAKNGTLDVAGDDPVRRHSLAHRRRHRDGQHVVALDPAHMTIQRRAPATPGASVQITTREARMRALLDMHRGVGARERDLRHRRALEHLGRWRRGSPPRRCLGRLGQSAAGQARRRLHLGG